MLSSCSLFNGSQNSKIKYQKFDSTDYKDHFEFIKKDYLKSLGNKIIPINKQTQDYLSNIYYRIVDNNELLLDPGRIPHFYIIKDTRPFIFSLSRANYFISTSLIKNFFKSEDVFIASFTFEIIKSHRDLYLENFVVPTGPLSSDRLIAMTHVSIETKMEIAKWTFHALKRAGYDPNAYLNWLQTQNKNSLEFGIHLVDGRSISREEYLFKSFLASQGRQDRIEISENSSQGFYRFLNYINHVY